MAALLVTNAHLLADPAHPDPAFLLIEHGTIREIGAMADAPTGYAAELDAAGGTVLPGFVDSHVHAVEAGVELLRCDMSDCSTTAELLARVSSYAARLEPGKWVVGRGWDPAILGAGRPTLAELDRATGGLPAYLNSSSGHVAFVNSAAMAACSIGDGTPDPAGGSLGRNSAGKLDGVLHESAMSLVESRLPALTPGDLRAGFRKSQDVLLSLGVTAWQEAIVGPFVQTTDVFDTYVSAVADGELVAKVSGAFWWPRGERTGALDGMVRQRALLTQNQFRCPAVKIMYDGSVASHTAAMSRPYRGGGTGTTFFSADELREIVLACDRADFDVHIHANGDRAVDDALSAIEHASALNPPRDRRHQLAHLAILRDDQVERMARLGVIAVIQPFWAQYSARVVDGILPALAEELHPLLYRFRSLQDAGVMLSFSSDWPVSTPDPLTALQVALTRSHPDAALDRALGEDQALSLTDAIASGSATGAYALRREHEIGRLAAGFAADLVVLEGRLDETTSMAGSCRVAHTVIDGKVVYSR